MKNRTSLIESIEAGNNHTYVYFWGHKGKKGFMSQWYESAPFVIEGITYNTAEHWMMASKAKLFNDEKSFNTIIKTASPAAVKACGRVVSNFDSRVWDSKSYDLVVEGNIAKFTQNRSIKDLLLSTNDAVLVEASPYDKIWGIGYHCSDRQAADPYLWNGENKLGFALMEVRDYLRSQ